MAQELYKIASEIVEIINDPDQDYCTGILVDVLWQDLKMKLKSGTSMAFEELKSYREIIKAGEFLSSHPEHRNKLVQIAQEAFASLPIPAN